MKKRICCSLHFLAYFFLYIGSVVAAWLLIDKLTDSKGDFEKALLIIAILAALLALPFATFMSIYRGTDKYFYPLKKMAFLAGGLIASGVPLAMIVVDKNQVRGIGRRCLVRAGVAFALSLIINFMIALIGIYFSIVMNHNGFNMKKLLADASFGLQITPLVVFPAIMTGFYYDLLDNRC